MNTGMEAFISPKQKIVIIPVANGWIVELPESDNENLMETMASSLKNVLSDEDPMLRPKQSATEEHEPIKLRRDKCCYVFSAYEEVLAFLSVKIDE